MTDSKLLGLQSGFRSGRLTTEQTMTLHFLVDAARTRKRSLIVVLLTIAKPSVQWKEG